MRILQSGGRYRHRRILLALYLISLLLSQLVQLLSPNRGRPEPGQSLLHVGRVEAPMSAAVRIHAPADFDLAYYDLPADPDAPETTPLILLHGSPAGARLTFEGFLPELSERRRILVPDLPGFGGSGRVAPSYGIRAHAHYVLQLMDALDIDAAHVLGYSQGGGVAIEMAQAEPERLRSLVLMAGIGVQELELFGDYSLNHAVYAFQWALLKAADLLLPHFGSLDRFPLNHYYARNFYDSDQRPLRAYLEAWDGPSLILHGQNDHQVPVAAALEHHRILPQSQLALLPIGHGMTFRSDEAAIAAEALEAFLLEVEQGIAANRAEADPLRIQEAAASPTGMVLRAEGRMLLVLLLLLAMATLVSEDLTSLAAGLLVARGTLDLGPAVLACFLGIVLGDLALYAGGRLLGARALRRRPFRWLIKPEPLMRAERWFAERGALAILGARFVPGLRLPTYFAAGTLRAPLFRSLAAFALAAGLWVPLLVALAASLGPMALELADRYQRWSLWILGGGVAAVWMTINLGLPALTWRRRRRLLYRFRRCMRWEYWPAWLFYAPVLLRILWLGLRYRSASLFTAANPAIPAGGFVGESKSEIFRMLQAAGAPVPAFVRIDGELEAAAKQAALEAFMAAENLSYPIVIKPNAGQRGTGVLIARNGEQARAHLAGTQVDMLAQAFATGQEYGVFYLLEPGADSGRIFSITEKRKTSVVGDGLRSLEDLVLADERAMCSTEIFQAEHAERWLDVPASGEEVVLAQIGTHCRGAEFRDAGHLASPELLSALDRFGRRMEGFHFGRYDLVVPSAAALRDGRGIQIIELNGVTAEATHIYDPRYGILEAWRTLAEQWRLAFHFGALNRARGHSPSGLIALATALLDYEPAV